MTIEVIRTHNETQRDNIYSFEDWEEPEARGFAAKQADDHKGTHKVIIYVDNVGCVVHPIFETPVSTDMKEEWM